MKLVLAYLGELVSSALGGWTRFWFTPSDPATLGLIRILGGAMLFYTHLVWTKDFDAFFGPDAWLSREAVRSFQTGSMQGSGPPRRSEDSQPAGPATAGQPGLPQPPFHGQTGLEMVPAVPLDSAVTSGLVRSYAWSWFNWIDNPGARWTFHLMALVAFACLMLGWHTRVAAIVAWLATVSYANRVPGALFGLDQINGMLAMYLAIGPSGSGFSLDRWRRGRGAAKILPPAPSIGTNIAIRLMQVHMCVIYFFAGTGKLLGPSWWDGRAMWLTFSNLEYQSLDMTWMANWPLLVNFMTHITVLWEIFFCVLVWPRLTRPLMLLVALPLHLGIAICLGMPTFGLVMLIGCASFISPSLVRQILDRTAVSPVSAKGAPPRGGKAPVVPAGS